MWSFFIPGKHSLRLLMILLLPITGLILLLLQSGDASAEQYTPPDLDGFKLHHEREMDGDGDKITETNVKKYLNQSGDSVVSMTTKDRLWAWSLNTHDNESGIHNYVIRDSNCDGVFDEVYGLDDEFHVPACLK
jgi:hypothetical protein